MSEASLAMQESALKVKEATSFAAEILKNKKQHTAAKKKLICATCVSIVFIALELYGGYLAGSIAIFADSAHLGSDILGFGISMIAL